MTYLGSLVWTAIDADAEVVVNWQFGADNAVGGYDTMWNIIERLESYVQLTTDNMVDLLPILPCIAKS